MTASERKAEFTVGNSRSDSISHKHSNPPSPVLPTAKSLYIRISNAVQKIRSLLKESPLQVLGLSQKKSCSLVEIVDQSRLLVEDYIYHRIEDWKGSAQDGGQDDLGACVATDVSKEIIIIGSKLTDQYPQLYQNVAKQTGLVFRSDTAARKALNVIGDCMFKHSITWCRIVALFAITGAIAIECVQNEQPDVIRSLVNIFADVIEKHCAGWISEQGGWIEITKVYRFNRETRSLWSLTGLGLATGFLITWTATGKM